MSTGLDIEQDVAEMLRKVLRAARIRTRPSSPSARAASLFCSPQAELLKQEIVRTGHKLWRRGYVDGNGGNISARLGDYVLCTPTLVSKGD